MMGADRTTGRKGFKAFGHISQLGLQNELKTLGEMGADVETRMLALVLRIRVDRRDGWTHDKLETLAEWMGLDGIDNPRTVARRMHWLTSRGVAKAEKMSVVNGPQGAAWSWRRRMLPYSEWPKSMTTQAGSSSEEGDSRGGLSLEEEGDSRGGRGGLPTAYTSSPKGEREGSRSSRSRSPRSPSGKKQRAREVELSADEIRARLKVVS